MPEIQSTNTQGWKQKYTTNKPLRKAKEQVYAGISMQWFYIFAFWCVVFLFLATPTVVVHNWVLKCLGIAVCVVWWVIYLFHFRTCEHYEESMLTIRFMFDEYKGNHEVCKFDMDLEKLQTYIPVKAIHENGLIQFTRGRFGVLIEYFPPSDPGEQMEAHLLNIQGLINRLSGDMQANFISSSRFGTQSPLLKKLERMINDPKTSKKNLKLIKSQYDKIKSGKPTPDWAFYIALGLGSHATIEDAKETLNTELPGFLDGLSDAGIVASQITDKTEIVKRYIQFMVPRDF